MTTQRLSRRHQIFVAASAAVVAASLVTVGIISTVTDAAYSDFANVNTGSGTGDGIGVTQNFDIALIDRTGLMAAGLPTAPTTLAIAPEVTRSLTPGRTIETTVTAFNNTPRWKARVGLSVSSTGAAAMLAHLRFTAVDVATGEVVFGDATDPTKGRKLDEANAMLARTLAGSGKAPLSVGQATASVPAAARTDIRLIVAYVDDLSAAEKTSLNGTTVPLSVTFTAEKAN